MTIKVIERTTNDIEQETIQLWKDCQPYLKQGLPLQKAVKKARNIRESTNICGLRWYKDLRDYALENGYVRKR